MKKRKTLAVIVAALLAVAPISAPFVNNNNNAQVVQASRRHVSRRTYYTHSRNWVTKHFYNRNTGRRGWMRMRNSPAWQRAYKKSIAEFAHDDADKCYNYNNFDIIQKIKAYNNQCGSTLFPSNHAVIYLVPYKGIGYKKLLRTTIQAAQMWAPVFHFTFTDDPRNANVTVTLSPARNHEADIAEADEEDCDFEPETHKAITLYWYSLRDDHCGYSGLKYVIAHELGHAIGLPHDTNLDSVMNCDDSEYEPLNKDDFKHYQPSWVTAANKRVVEELYHEN